ncbi:MAG: hypothetical protein JRF45_11345 [Deltaproteobacteria bacterium]|nr:hypothetical protein [Deltaproteobacteria bacterium]
MLYELHGNIAAVIFPGPSLQQVLGEKFSLDPDISGVSLCRIGYNFNPILK